MAEAWQGRNHERTPLLHTHAQRLLDAEAASVISSHVSKEEANLAGTAVGERLPYNDYTTIDWLHDLLKDSLRKRYLRTQPGIRFRILSQLDSIQGWVAAGLIGVLTAIIAYAVDIGQAWVFDWKEGYCIGGSSIFTTKESCCYGSSTLDPDGNCSEWHYWRANKWERYPMFMAIAVLYGVFSCSITMLTKHKLPSAQQGTSGKVMYMAGGSGIPEIKTILSGFVIKGFLGFKVLVVKAVGATFATGSGMCLGKEGPFVHISACVGNIVGGLFPKYRGNGRKRRELLSAAVSSGLSVAFGAPIGGVLFSFEEISTYFPRKVLWRSFFCSLVAAITLKFLNPLGTGKLVLFETRYNSVYQPIHYLFFVVLGIVGGIFGAAFCKANHAWSKWFRAFPIIKKNPVFETFLIVLLTAAVQFPNPLVRVGGDTVIKTMLVNCESQTKPDWVCRHESGAESYPRFIFYLVHGTLAKLILTVVTFGVKVPSGIIIPSLDAGALFGRLLGQLPMLAGTISPGIFAMVGAASFLAGVTRMTLSLCVIMFELTGSLEYAIPNMIAIIVAKWTADAFVREGVYDLAQNVLGHPFLDAESGMEATARQGDLAEKLIPPEQTMAEITVVLDDTGKCPRHELVEKLALLRRRGLMDAGLVLTSKSTNGLVKGYIAEGELEFGLNNIPVGTPEPGVPMVLLVKDGDGKGPEDDATPDLSVFVDRTPLGISAAAPMEYVVEMFGKLGLRYLMIVDEETGGLRGVVIKKRLVGYLDNLVHGR